MTGVLRRFVASWAILVPFVPAVSLAAPDEEAILKEVKVPAGFEAKVFATAPEVNYPVYVAAAPDGTLFVSSDKNGSLDRKPERGRVLRVRDTNGDGRADEVKAFVPNVDSPRGLVWDHDRIYLMHPPHLSAFIDKDFYVVSDEQKILVKNIAFTFKDRPADHTSNGVTLGIDGWLYLAIGDFGFMEAEGADGTKLQLRGGGVVRVRPDGSDLHVYSRGTRNILEVGLDPLLNGFTRDNTNDGGGWDIRLHHFSGGEHHGYPSLYKNFNDEIVQPLADYGGGSGCGVCYISEPGFPEGYGDAMYTADWGRSWIYRHRLTPKGATFTADQTEFVSVPRVTDLDVDAQGHVYVASWKGATFTYAGENVGYIVRVQPKDYKAQPLPDFNKASDDELVKLLESPSHRIRLEAQRTLLRRGVDGDTSHTIRRIARDPSKSLNTRLAAYFAIGAFANLLDDPVAREYTVRFIAEPPPGGELEKGAMTNLAKDPNPRVRLQIARLLGFGHVEPDAVASLLGDGDQLVVHTAVHGLADGKHHAECFKVLDNVKSTELQRNNALWALRLMHEPAVVDGLIARVDKASDPILKLGMLTALCRLYFLEGKWTGSSWGTRPDTSGPYYQPESWSETPKIAAKLKAVLAASKPEDAGPLLAQLTRHKIELEGTLDLVLAAAAKSPAALPAAVAQLSRAGTIPPAALPLLCQAAKSDDVTSQVRSQAVVALCKLGEAEGFDAVLAAMPKLEKTGKDKRDFIEARNALTGAAALENHHGRCESLAAQVGEPLSVWSDAALLALSARSNLSPEAKETVHKSLAEGWQQPARRAQILTAVALIGHRPYSDKIVVSLTDPDKDVAAAAKRAAGELKIDTKPRPRPGGPLVETMQPDDVVATALKQKADPVVGEQLFLKMDCTKCHTLRQEEPLKGPFLGHIASTYKRKELAEAVILPSKSISQGFATNQFILDDGRVITGFVVTEAADKVIVRNIEGKEFEIPTASIEERIKQTISMMPEGQAKKLTLGEFISLVDFLESLVKK